MTLLYVPWCQDLRQRDPDTGLLIPPTDVKLFARGSLTDYAPLFADGGGATSLANPLPTGANPPSDPSGILVGVDTAGNGSFWIAPGLWDIVIDGTRFPLDIGVSGADAATHLQDTGDAHGLQTWATGQFLQASALGDPGGAAQLDENGVLVTGQVLMSVPS